MLSGRGIDKLTSYSVEKSTTCLYISDNEFVSLESLIEVPEVEEVIADNNKLSHLLNLPLLPKLRLLSLNKNKITDLEELLDGLSRSAPSLQMLSLLGNPVCPDAIFQHISGLAAASESPLMHPSTSDPMEDGDEDEYLRYRLRIIYKLPKLRFIDFSPVTPEERKEAKKRGPYLRIVRPSTPVTSQSPAEASSQEKTNLVESWNDEEGEFKYTPLPDADREQNPSQAAFGKCRYVYNGKHSEGNRFITNMDL